MIPLTEKARDNDSLGGNQLDTATDHDLADTTEEFISQSLYETDSVIVVKNTPEGPGDIWYSVRVMSGATVDAIQIALNNLPEYATFDDGDVLADGSAWLDFSR